MKITQISIEDIPLVLRVVAERLGSVHDAHEILNAAQHLRDAERVLEEHAALLKACEDDEGDA